MSIIKKNPNEAAFAGGEKHWADVIKNSGDGKLLIWRQPEEDFNTNSTLIVMPGEEAIFVNKGEIEEVFQKGTHKLSTNNYPFISRLRTAFTGGISTFNCVVYFVRTAHSAEILWGTNTPIQIRDKFIGDEVAIRAHGSYKVQVTNPSLFLEKLVGNNIAIQTQEDLNQYFANEFQSKIKTVLTKAIDEIDQELLGIESKLDELSQRIEPSFVEILDEYGLKCVRFVIASMQLKGSEYRDGYDEAMIERLRKIRNAEGDDAVFKILGEKWGAQKASEILQALAENPGAGGAAAAGAGIGMGFAAGNTFAGLANQMFAPINSQTQNQQSMQQNTSASERFAPKKDATASSSETIEDPLETLKKLKAMLDAGVIEQSDYNAKKDEILGRM